MDLNRSNRGKRRWFVRMLVVLGVATGLLLTSGDFAFADGSWNTTAWAPCSKIWNYNAYGATARAYESYTATTSTSSYVKINTALAKVDYLIDCGPAGRDVTAYSIQVDVQFKFKGTSLSCSAGYPLSFSCSVSGSYEYGNFSTTCSPNKLTCQYGFGALYFYAPPDGWFNNVAWMQTTVTLRRNDGYAFTFQTQAV